MSAKLLVIAERISKFTATIAAVALLLVVVVIMVEVVGRAIGRPLVGGIEIIRVTFLVAVFFAFAHVLIKERDIRVDVMRSVLPVKAMRILDVLAALISALLFGFMLYFSLHELQRAISGGVYLEGRLLLPMWLPWGTIVIGSILAALAGVVMAYHYATRPDLPAEDAGLADRFSQIS